MATTPVISEGAQNTLQLEQGLSAILSQILTNSNHPAGAALISQVPALIQLGTAVAAHPNASNILQGFCGILQALCGAGIVKLQ